MYILPQAKGQVRDWLKTYSTDPSVFEVVLIILVLCTLSGLIGGCFYCLLYCLDRDFDRQQKKTWARDYKTYKAKDTTYKPKEYQYRAFNVLDSLERDYCVLELLKEKK